MTRGGGQLAAMVQGRPAAVQEGSRRQWRAISQHAAVAQGRPREVAAVVQH